MNRDQILISPRLIRLAEELRQGQTQALDIFWSEMEHAGTPLFEDIEGDSEGCLVTLLWRDREGIDNISVMGELFGMNTENTRLSRLMDTDIWYRSWQIGKAAWSLYFFTVNEPEGDCEWEDIDARLDPLNPRVYTCPIDEEYPGELPLLLETESVAAAPEHEKNMRLIEKNYVIKGKLEQHRLEGRRLWVYTPAGYDREAEPYGLVVFTDGWEYINLTKAPVILDNLIDAGKIPPVCAVFIDTHKNRSEDLACSEAFRGFVTESLLPWLYDGYNVTRAADRIAAAGFSLGGLDAAFGAMQRPDIFGKVLAQSGAFHWELEGRTEKEWLLNELEKREPLPVDFFLSMGEYEIKHWDVGFRAVERLDSILDQKGIRHSFVTSEGGHNSIDCQLTLPEGLIFLIGDHK